MRIAPHRAGEERDIGEDQRSAVEHEATDEQNAHARRGIEAHAATRHTVSAKVAMSTA